MPTEIPDPKTGGCGPELSSLLTRDFWLQKKVWVPASVLLIIGVILTVALVPPSFSYVGYNELAFKKNTISNKVDNSTVYENGRYFWGVSVEPLTFPSKYQLIAYKGNDLLIFSTIGTEFPIEVDVYWKFANENLAKIFGKFGKDYNKPFTDKIKASIKNTAPKFTVDQYIANRSYIAETMLNDINTDLSEVHLHINPHKFLLKRIDFPSNIKDKFLRTAVQALENAKALLQQEVELINKETEELIEEIQANITIVNQLAKAQADAIIKSAEADASKIIQEATGDGINYLFEQLNVTNPMDRDKMFQILTILDNENDPKVLIGELGALLTVST